jgi:Na+-translocating ferredoxin:NAD+ oxidoreductase RnfG subunit
MKMIVHYTTVLLIVAAAATAALAATYRATAPAIAVGEARAQENALGEIFFAGFDRAEKLTGAAGEYYAIYLRAGDTEPDYFAALGKGLGYNKSTPIELLVGFVNPHKRGVELPGGEKYAVTADNGAALICAGWKVVKSQETPGLGENAKAQRAPFTWWQLLTGNRPEASRDRRTAFQQQFAGKVASEMVVKKNIDIITGATYSTNGIVAAINDAAKIVGSR